MDLNKLLSKENIMMKDIDLKNHIDLIIQFIKQDLIMIIQITIIMGIKNLINLLMKRKKIMDTNNLTNKNMMTILTNKAMSIIILFKEIMVDVQTVINVLKVNAVLNGDIAV